MENYKLASQQKLRFMTPKGLLSTEQLWELSIEELDSHAVFLDEQYKKSDKKSFLVSKSEKDKTAKLKLDIVLDVLTTKVEEQERLAKAQEDKEHNKKIIALISEKKDDALKGKSVKQLEDMLR